METIRWTEAEMIEATCEHFGDGSDPADCRVIRDADGGGEPCLIMVHRPTGRTSTEAGDAGRWHLDRTAY